MYIYMGVSKNRGTPKSSILIIRVFPYKPSILGYPYSWKHPHIYIYNFNIYIYTLCHMVTCGEDPVAKALETAARQRKQQCLIPKQRKNARDA